MSALALANTGSFRDPTGRVYELELSADGLTSRRVLRGVDQVTLDNQEQLLRMPFYQSLVEAEQIVGTKNVSSDVNDPSVEQVLSDGWAGVLEHDEIPYITYPYEWSFSMYREAALLHLEILEKSLESGWILKDATPYNIQWRGTKPVFIDTPSFIPWVEGSPWVAYRQFCSMFFSPLAIRNYLGIDHRSILRSNLNGIDPVQAVKYFTGLKKFKKGVLSHIVFPSRVEMHILNKERDDATAAERKSPKHSKAMVIGLVQSMARLISKMDLQKEKTDWSDYEETHSYSDTEHVVKKEFIEEVVARKAYGLAWDLGCNTGEFSRVCEKKCEYVVAVDGDHGAIEKLYKSQKKADSNTILPLTLNLSNLSPSQGWASSERIAFDQRKSPDLVVCLALIHHLRITENIPNRLFLKWLKSLESDVVIEFVGRDDEMVVKLLTNKDEKYEDYNLQQFVDDVECYFDIETRKTLKGGKREIFFLVPKKTEQAQDVASVQQFNR